MTRTQPKATVTAAPGRRIPRGTSTTQQARASVLFRQPPRSRSPLILLLVLTLGSPLLQSERPTSSLLSCFLEPTRQPFQLAKDDVVRPLTVRYRLPRNSTETVSAAGKVVRPTMRRKASTQPRAMPTSRDVAKGGQRRDQRDKGHVSVGYLCGYNKRRASDARAKPKAGGKQRETKQSRPKRCEEIDGTDEIAKLLLLESYERADT